jgi:hypothetical protein
VARQVLSRREWKVRPLLGWIFGLLVGVLAFLTVGAAILFPIAYSGAHRGFASAGIFSLVLLGSFTAVAGTCFWLAYRVKKAVTRDVRSQGFADRAAGLIVAGVVLLFALAFFLLADAAPPQVPDFLPASD